MDALMYVMICMRAINRTQEQQTFLIGIGHKQTIIAMPSFKAKVKSI